jgi:hypothetical protein
MRADPPSRRRRRRIAAATSAVAIGRPPWLPGPAEPPIEQPGASLKKNLMGGGGAASCAAPASFAPVAPPAPASFAPVAPAAPPAAPPAPPVAASERAASTVREASALASTAPSKLCARRYRAGSNNRNNNGTTILVFIETSTLLLFPELCSEHASRNGPPPCQGVRVHATAAADQATEGAGCVGGSTLFRGPPPGSWPRSSTRPLAHALWWTVK